MFTPSRRALVTGAGSGIGRAIAARLSAEGIAVFCADRDAEAAARTAEDAGGAGGRAEALTLDIADDASVDRLAGAVLGSSLPGAGLDVLVNCAAISDATPTIDLTIGDVRRVLDVNLVGTLAVTLALLPLVRASATGRILLVGSIQGFVATTDTLAYAASKGGVLAATRALAADLADDGVLVNALAPGFVDTPMARLPDGTTEYDTELFRDVYVRHGKLPLGRPARPEEIAETALFLCSERNSYMTGAVLTADGGMTAVF
jgi:3-oxoacyl-[acyl-carrier protein] reductase